MKVRRRGLRPMAALVAALACGGGGGSGGGSGSSLFQMSGEIQIAFASAVDGDVNDPSVPPVPNDTPETAQPIPNPVTLGGYVNVTGQGDPGNFFDPLDSSVLGDTQDFFRVSLAAGQTVRLFMAGDGVADDLDLALEDLDGGLIAFSDTNTPAEAVVVPAPGEYLIEVSAFAGASNYVLSIGQATDAALAPARAPEFVPGELIVRYRDGGSARGTRRAREAAVADAAQLGLARVGGGESGPQLLSGRDPEQLDGALRALGKEFLGEGARVRRGARAGFGPRERDAALRRDTRRLAKALRRRAGVASADLNYVRHASSVPTDPLYPLQWHYPLVRLPEAWDLVTPASGVVVAVIDTGIVEEHPDLQGQLVPGYDFILDKTRSRDGDGCDADPSDPGDVADPGKSSFHGTHVAGTVVARTTFAPGAPSDGVAGVAWNARVMPLRVLGAGGGTDFDLIQALRYAAGLSNGCGVLPAAPADVINLSLGGPDPSPTLDEALAEVRGAGLVVVAAAGNEATSLPSYPAASPGVISVSAVDSQLRLAPYSNYGSTIDLAAPGGDMRLDRNLDGYPDGVLSTLYDDLHGTYVYGFYQGTSMATPHVSGVIALMLGVNPALTPADIDALLAAGSMTRNIGSSNLFGHGLLDAFAAVRAAIEAKGGTIPALPPRLAANPGALNFGATSIQASVTLSNDEGSTPALSISSYEPVTDDGGAWLSIQAASVDASGLGTYTLHVSRQGLADGIYTGAARFHSSAGDLDVPVILQAGSAVAADANAGHHYVLLVNPDDLSTVAYVEVDARNGRYTYRFSDVQPGDYYVYAGTDIDNDGFLCDRGEACGSYPTLDLPRLVHVGGDMQGVDFLTGFGLRLGAQGTQATQGGLSRRLAPAPTLAPSG